MSETSGMVEKPGTRSISAAMEDIEQAVIDLLGETSLLPGQRLSAMANVAMDMAPAGCDLKIVVMGDFVESVKSRLDPNSEEAKSCGVERGANQAIARTLRRGSNGFDILFSDGILFSAEGQVHSEHDPEFRNHVSGRNHRAGCRIADSRRSRPVRATCR